MPYTTAKKEEIKNKITVEIVDPDADAPVTKVQKKPLAIGQRRPSGQKVPMLPNKLNSTCFYHQHCLEEEKPVKKYKKFVEIKTRSLALPNKLQKSQPSQKSLQAPTSEELRNMHGVKEPAMDRIYGLSARKSSRERERNS